jgi:hypothetical protein
MFPGEKAAAIKEHVMAIERENRRMIVQKRRELRPVHRRHRDRSGDFGKLWSYVGVDVEDLKEHLTAPGPRI